MGTAYYNEIEPYAAQWLRNLITRGLIAPGVVDERSIEDVTPDDLREFTQCHFFAGIGIWSLALRNAGWSDDRPVWSGSCPCQPFSSAGKANGFDDERHLWPAFHHLISECRPPAVFGEQVASKDADPWIDLVQADMEALGYAFGAVPFPSASVGAPHIRDRLYWVGERLDNTNGQRLGEARCSCPVNQNAEQCSGNGVGLADTGCQRRQQVAGSAPCDEAADGRTGRQRCQSNGDHESAGHGEVRGIGLGHAIGAGLEGYPGHEHNGNRSGRIVTPEDRPIAAPGCTNGFWRDCDWLPFRDGKVRPIESGTQPLVDGNPTIVGRLRAYGNAINAVQAEEFIRAWLACRPV